MSTMNILRKGKYMSPSTYLWFPMLYSTKKITEIHMYVYENDCLLGAQYFLIKKRGGIKLKAASLPSLTDCYLCQEPKKKYSLSHGSVSNCPPL